MKGYSSLMPCQVRCRSVYGNVVQNKKRWVQKQVYIAPYKKEAPARLEQLIIKEEVELFLKF